MLGYPTTPPPPPRGARRLTAQPPTPKIWVNQGGGVPPPTAPKTVAHPLGSHIGWEQFPCGAHTWRTQIALREGGGGGTDAQRRGAAPHPPWQPWGSLRHRQGPAEGAGTKGEAK